MRRLDLRELRFRSQLTRDRTFRRNRPDLDTHTVRQTGAFLGNGEGFVHRSDVEKKIAANRFLGFCEWPIGDDALFSRNDISGVMSKIIDINRRTCQESLTRRFFAFQIASNAS